MRVGSIVGILADITHPEGFPTLVSLSPKEGRLTLSAVNPLTEAIFEFDISVKPQDLATLDYAEIVGEAILALEAFTGRDGSPLAPRVGRSPSRAPSLN